MKTNLELCRGVMDGNRWLQETPRRECSFFVTHKHCIIIYISSPSAPCGIFAILPWIRLLPTAAHLLSLLNCHRWLNIIMINDHRFWLYDDQTYYHLCLAVTDDLTLLSLSLSLSSGQKWTWALLSKRLTKNPKMHLPALPTRFRRETHKKTGCTLWPSKPRVFYCLYLYL